MSHHKFYTVKLEYNITKISKYSCFLWLAGIILTVKSPVGLWLGDK